MKNRISADLNEATRTQLLQFIAQAKLLLPFLLALEPGERKSKRGMGQSSVGYVRESLALARQHSDILPGNFSIDEFERDVRLMEALDPVYSELTAFCQMVSDTRFCLGQEALNQAGVVYDSLKVHSKRNGEFRVHRQRLSDFYKRTKKQDKGELAKSGA